MNIEFLNSCIANFISYLNINYQLVNQSYEMHKFYAEHEKLFLVSFEEYFDDWAQANWELLVERVVCSTNESFVIYGSGSDYEAAAHSRVFFHNIEATHKIICIAKSTVVDRLSKSEVDLTKFDFEAFVTFDGRWFNMAPPFDHVLLTEQGAIGGSYQQIVIPVEQINFGVQKIGI